VAGVGGCLYVYLLQAFSPTVFGPDQSFLVFTTAVVGGIGSLLGAALGAIYLEGGQWFLPGAEWQALVSAVGVLLVLMIVPGGLSDVVYRVRDAWLRWVATRRDIVVPSLLADSAADRPGGLSESPLPDPAERHLLAANGRQHPAGEGDGDSGDGVDPIAEAARHVETTA
jgi:hypothetical protein